MGEISRKGERWPIEVALPEATRSVSGGFFFLRRPASFDSLSSMMLFILRQTCYASA